MPKPKLSTSLADPQVRMPAVDLAFVTTAIDGHEAAITALLPRARYLLVEKPLTVSATRATSLAGAAWTMIPAGHGILVARPCSRPETCRFSHALAPSCTLRGWPFAWMAA